MSSFYIGINGPWWGLSLAIGVCFLIALTAYLRTVPPVPGFVRSVLIALRFLAIAVLALALFEPVLVRTGSKVEEPKVIVLVDNSLSMTLSDRLGSRKDALSSVLKSPQLQRLAGNAEFYTYADLVRATSQDSVHRLNANGQLTDISAALRHTEAINRRANVGAVVLIGDGVYNAGSNPLYDANASTAPIYTIGVGDTVPPADLVVQNPLTNEVAYVGSTLPVTVNIQSRGLASQRVRVTLSDSKTTIASQELVLDPSRQIYTLTFAYTPSQEGTQRLRVQVEPIQGELTNNNNSASAFVKVRKNKRRVSVFAGSPSPDLSFVQNVLRENKEFEVQAFVQKSGSTWYDREPSQSDLRQSDLIVLVGFPISMTSAQSLSLIREELDRGKPLVFIASRQMDYQKLVALGDAVPFEVRSSSQREFLVTPNVKSDNVNHPVMSVLGTSQDVETWNSLPPIFHTETFVKPRVGAQVLATIKVNGAAINEPLIIYRDAQGKKSLAFMGYGLFRWSLLGYAADLARGKEDGTDILRQVLDNSVRYLTVEDNSSKVRVKTTKRSYASGEKIEFVGQVYDPTMEPLSDADLSVAVAGVQKRELRLVPLGSGRYQGSLDGLPAGEYTFSANAQVKGANYGQDNGRFVVGDVSLEYQETTMNAQLMRMIAERSGGRFYTPATIGSLQNDISSNKRFAPVVTSQKEESPLWSLPAMLIVAVVCFALEWFVRKRSGMV